ncbi:MAG: hypothetical protein K1Y36_28850 [Blastocatellia bacterium]|nr:hypothetical protein [Blastocatellia bacterium]
MALIKFPVGLGKTNRHDDVKQVQRLLNLNKNRMFPVETLTEDGFCGPKTRAQIGRFQRSVMFLPLSQATGYVAPDDATYNGLCWGAREPWNVKVPQKAVDMNTSMIVQQKINQSEQPAHGKNLAKDDFFLSPNFTFFQMTATTHTEFLAQNRKEAMGFVDTGKVLCTTLLEPIFQKFPNIKVTSGFRCPALNKAVKGSPSSQHMKFQAVDFILPGRTYDDLCWFIKQNEKTKGNQHGIFTFGQFILEGPPGRQWLHFSLGEPYHAPFPPERHIMAIKNPPSLGK